MFTTFSAWTLDFLSKAAGHKYIRRIPYASGGKTRYRYIYKVTHTAGSKHALHEDDVTVGAAFMLGTDKGAEVHAHVKSVDGDKVTVEYDDGPRKGEKETMSKRDLLSKLDAAHGISQALQGEREKQAKVVADLKARGASEKQVAREQARLERLSVSAPAPKSEESATSRLRARAAAAMQRAESGPAPKSEEPKSEEPKSEEPKSEPPASAPSGSVTPETVGTWAEIPAPLRALMVKLSKEADEAALRGNTGKQGRFLAVTDGYVYATNTRNIVLIPTSAEGRFALTRDGEINRISVLMIPNTPVVREVPPQSFALDTKGTTRLKNALTKLDKDVAVRVSVQGGKVRITHSDKVLLEHDASAGAQSTEALLPVQRLLDALRTADGPSAFHLGVGPEAPLNIMTRTARHIIGQRRR